MDLLNSQPTVVSTFASPREPTLQPIFAISESKVSLLKLCRAKQKSAKLKACKRTSAFPAQVAHRAFGFADPQKNKIYLCFVDRSPK